MSPPHPVTKRRNGRLQACEPCRIGKSRCDHSIPVCNRCTARGQPGSCVYHPAPMTKVKAPGIRNSKLPKLLPEIRLPQDTGIMTPTSLSSSTYKSPQTTLFRRKYDKTSFSAVFHENQAQIGDDLLGVDVDELGMQQQVDGDPVRMKIAIQTLHDFPSSKASERFLSAFSAMDDPWLSPKMITNCLKSIWITFGDALVDPRSDQGMSSMAGVLFRNGENAASPDEAQPWMNWYGGSTLRWEMIGIIYAFFGLVIMYLQDWDPIFNLPEYNGRPRKLIALRMQECAERCFGLRNSDHAISDMIVILLKNSGKLQSQVVGDESDEVSMSEGLFITAFIEAGLHRLPDNGQIDAHSQFRRTLSASGYYLEKCSASFRARPPALSRFYCRYQIPLDLTEDQLYGSKEDLATAVSRLDQSGWNTSINITAITWSRALFMITPIREEILEISMGMNIQTDPDRPEQLLRDLASITSKYPPWIQYCNIGQWAQPSFSPTSSKNFYIVTRIHAEVLLTKFLLERIKPPSSTDRRNQDLFDVAQELMALTLSMWIARDRLMDYHGTFHWLAVDYGIPAAGILCVELLYATRYPRAPGIVSMSRSYIIESLVMFVAFLDWVREGDGNYELCRRLRKVIRNILDYLLAAPLQHRPDDSSTDILHDGQYDFSWSEIGEPDWLSVLDNMDWTQRFEGYHEVPQDVGMQI